MLNYSLIPVRQNHVFGTLYCKTLRSPPETTFRSKDTRPNPQLGFSRHRCWIIFFKNLPNSKNNHVVSHQVRYYLLSSEQPLLNPTFDNSVQLQLLLLLALHRSFFPELSMSMVIDKVWCILESSHRFIYWVHRLYSKSRQASHPTIKFRRTTYSPSLSIFSFLQMTRSCSWNFSRSILRSHPLPLRNRHSIKNLVADFVCDRRSCWNYWLGGQSYWQYESKWLASISGPRYLVGSPSREDRNRSRGADRFFRIDHAENFLRDCWQSYHSS